MLRRYGAERDWLASFATVGLAACTSVTNFLLVRVGDHEVAETVAEHLLRRGIVPRTFGAEHPLRGHLRFTVRDREQDERLVAALAASMDGRTA